MRKMLAALLGAATMAMAGTSAQAAPPIWQIRDDDTTITLFGSIHILPEGTQWRTPLFEDILDQADYVYFETDLGATPADDVVLTMLRTAVNDLGKRLHHFLDEDQRKSVEAAAAEAKIPFTTLEQFKPAAVAGMIEMFALKHAGYFNEAGVDASLYSELTSERRRYLESMEFQMQLIADMADEITTMPIDEQVGMLMTTVEAEGGPVGQIRAMVDAWLSGDDDDRVAAMIKEFGDAQTDFSGKVFDERNYAWRDTLLALMEEEAGHFLVVGGYGHMVGEIGLPTLLEAEGFKVERVQ